MFNLKKKKNEKIPKNIDEVIREIELVKSENEKLKRELVRIKKEQELCLQKVRMIRFNPFQTEGGNQSFSVAFLDKKGDGVAVTSLYTKDGNRVYGKPIKDGKSEYSLSQEEEKVIKEALKSER